MEIKNTMRHHGLKTMVCKGARVLDAQDSNSTLECGVLTKNLDIRKVRLCDLQPTHIPRTIPLMFMNSLSEEELRGLGMPQVWFTELDGLLISDGNNKCMVYARRGIKEIEVEYCNEDSPFGFLIDYTGIRDMARKLRARGIFTPYDLYRTRDGIIFEPAHNWENILD